MNTLPLANKAAEFEAEFPEFATYGIDARELFEAISSNDSGKGFDLIVQGIENSNPDGDTLAGLLDLMHYLTSRATEFFDGYGVCTTILRTLEHELTLPTLPKMRTPSAQYQEYLRVNRNRSFVGRQEQLKHILQHSRDQIAAMQLNLVVAHDSTANASFGAIMESLPRFREFSEQHYRAVQSKVRGYAGANEFEERHKIAADLIRQNVGAYEQYDNEVQELMRQLIAIPDNQLLGKLQERTGIDIASTSELAIIASCMHYNPELDAPLQIEVVPIRAFIALRKLIMTKLIPPPGNLPTTFSTSLRLEDILEKRVVGLILSMAGAKS